MNVMTRELNMLTKIHHKNIVQYIGLHIPQTEYENIFNCNIVMEYID